MSFYQPRTSSSEDDHLTPPNPLSPPRPFFLAGGGSDRGSWSNDSSLEPNSDSERDAPQPPAPRPRPPRTQQHQRRRSSMANAAVYAPVDPDPFNSPTESSPQIAGWSPASLYNDVSSPPSTTSHASHSPRPPPSSFAYPFQAYPGNPDPIPPRSRRNSADSIRMIPRSSSASNATGLYDAAHDDLARPYAPFMATGSSHGHSPSNSVYGNSAAAGLNRQGSAVQLADQANASSLPRVSSATFRAPFLSPASRPSSSLWSPPSYAHFPVTPGTGPIPVSPSASTSALALPKPKAPLPSTRLPTKLAKEDKPWLTERDSRARAAWWLTFLLIWLGAGGAAVLCWTGWNSVPLLKDSQLCLVMDDDFNSLDLTNNWSEDIELGGFGNGEFQMTTSSSSNIYTSNSELYIVPTLTSDVLSGGYQAVLNGANYTLSDCSTNNQTACTASSNADAGTVINPVMSARINTKGKQWITYGRVEVRAKLPSGDWLWPAIWMLPEDDTYGPWPLSGEIDIMEARGNSIAYPAQGSNYVRSSLNYGPLASLTHTIFGWFSQKRASFADDFHVYALEWDGSFMRFYTDNRLNKMLELTTTSAKTSFWNRAGFPQTAQNGSASVVVSDIYSQGSNSAPFDQSFYLLIDLAAGGTSGWFPDGVGGKPWYDASLTAMQDFAKAQDTWYATWPSNVDDRAFRVDYVKMWKMC